MLWLDDGVIMLRVNEAHRDPVELNEHEAQELVDCLMQLIHQSQALR